MMLRPLHKSPAFFLILAPGLVAVGLLMVLVFVAVDSTTPGWIALLVVGLLLCLAAALLYHLVSTSLLQPLTKSIALLQSQTAAQNPAPRHQEANHLARLMSLPSMLDAYLQDKNQLADTRETHARQLAEADAETRTKAREAEISAVQLALTEAVTAIARQEDNSITLQHNQQLLLALADTSLNTIIGCTNLLANPGVDAFAVRAKLKAASKRLLFYQTELRALARCHIAEVKINVAETKIDSLEIEASSAEFVLRDCIDQVIMLLDPLLGQQGWELQPVYDDSCQVNLVGRQSLLQALLFNYLLTAINHSKSNHEPVTAQSFLWHISLDNNTEATDQFNRLRLRLGHGLSMPPTRHSERLQMLLRSLSGLPEAEQLSLPVSCTKTPVRQCPAGLTARIYAANPNQETGIHNRLSQLGIAVQAQGTDVNLCFIGKRKHNDIVSIAGSFGPNTHILLLNNERLYSRSDWLSLPTPLQQTELTNLISTTFPMRADKQLNILVVDDDHHARLFLATLLRQTGYNVDEAADGLAALEVIAAQPVDLVFMDIHMPRMNGLEATRELRARLSRQLPVIALTAHLMETERDAVIAAGMNDILIKPLDFETLSKTLMSWLGGGIQDAAASYGSAESPQEAAVFDAALAMKIANQQPDLALEMLELFVQALPFEQQQLTQAVTENKPEQLVTLVHKLNGASRYCGIPRVQAALNELETLLKTGADGQALAIQRLHHELALLHTWYGQNPEPLTAIPRTQLRRLPAAH
jgi:CheY-like chemotaxis protein